MFILTRILQFLISTMQCCYLFNNKHVESNTRCIWRFSQFLFSSLLLFFEWFFRKQRRASGFKKEENSTPSIWFCPTSQCFDSRTCFNNILEPVLASLVTDLASGVINIVWKVNLQSTCRYFTYQPPSSDSSHCRPILDQIETLEILTTL